MRSSVFWALLNWAFLECSCIWLAAQKLSLLGNCFLLCQAQNKQDDEFCNIWQSLQGSGKSHHVQQNIHEKVSVYTSKLISGFKIWRFLIPYIISLYQKDLPGSVANKFCQSKYCCTGYVESRKEAMKMLCKW